MAKARPIAAALWIFVQARIMLRLDTARERVEASPREVCAVGLLERCRDRFAALCSARGVSLDRHVEVRPLMPVEAIGETAGQEFPIAKGKETVLEALFCQARGQAFTDRPSRYEGSLADILRLDLDRVEQRAIFVAVLNAVARYLGIAQGTVHCRNEAPSRCGGEVAGYVASLYGAVRVGLVGLQPALLEGLVQAFGPDRVRVLDLNPDNIGKERSGVPIWDGETDLEMLVSFSQVGLVTGSSIVSNTADRIAALYARAGKPILYYGNTISGAAALCDLPRFCPFGQ